MKKHNPGCKCCSCTGWANDPPVDEIQLVLPAGCERAGTHVLDRLDSAFYTSDCPTSTLGGIATMCAAYRLQIGSGSAMDTLYVNVGITSGGDTVIIAGVCNELGASGGAVDAGTLWGMVATIGDWNDLDGLSLPFTNRVTDVQGMADCSTDDPCTISFVP